jgi:hypothetical protein
LSPLRFRDGLIGRGVNPPPQFGQTLRSTVSTQVVQNVHSYEQIHASVESGGKRFAQFSQTGRSSSILHHSRGG